MAQLQVLEEAIEENTEAIEAIEDTNRLHIELRVYHIVKINDIISKYLQDQLFTSYVKR